MTIGIQLERSYVPCPPEHEIAWWRAFGIVVGYIDQAMQMERDKQSGQIDTEIHQPKPTRRKRRSVRSDQRN